MHKFLFIALAIINIGFGNMVWMDEPKPPLLTAAIEKPPTPKEALEELIKGNERHVNSLHQNLNRNLERRTAISEKQTPFAIVVGCSDSRVTPEIIFDQGLGEIFVVRIAGNVIGRTGLASVEYSAEYLHSPLIMVLGHENCGAIKAVLAGQTEDIEPIAIKVENAIKKYSPHIPDRVEDAVKANVIGVVEQLKEAGPLAQLIKEKKLAIVGGYYKLDTGKVSICCGLEQDTLKKPEATP